MGSAVLVILRSILLLYSAGSGVNRVQVVLSGFSVISSQGAWMIFNKTLDGGYCDSNYAVMA